MVKVISAGLARRMLLAHVRVALIREQRHRCYYCEGRFGKSQKNRATIDHVQPRSRGGSDNWENLVAACRFCNELKADMTLEEFTEYCRQLKEQLKENSNSPQIIVVASDE